MKAKICLCMAGMAGVLWLAGCTAPIGADQVGTRQAFAQVDANELRSGRLSAETTSILHRYELDRLSASDPEEAVRRLHQKALDTGSRNLLFALAELSYAAAEDVRRSVKPWDTHDARDCFLGSAVYAWLFLFGEGKEPQPDCYDRRFRDACDFYNYSLGLALTDSRNTNGLVRLVGGRRKLPVGELELRIDPGQFPSSLDEFDQILLADRYRVRGLSVRNRQSGVGAPLILGRKSGAGPEFRFSIPATALMQGPMSLRQLTATNTVCSLQLYEGYDAATVTIGTAKVPLEVDLTAYRAYTLNQSRIWKLGKLGFLAPGRDIKNQLILHQPYDPKRIPLVFVHGTFSSPVTWAEMVNTLTADPELRRRYQLWSFIYSTSNPLVYSIADLRRQLTSEVERIDPGRTNVLLQQMVVIGHSQGGLLTKGTAMDTGDRLWRTVSTNRLEDMNLTEQQKTKLRELLFYKPLPFVKRVVFIATPHRGSYLSGSFARRLSRKLISLPHTLVSRSSELLRLTEGSDVGKFLGSQVPTSLDGMSPKNPALLEMAETPVVPEIHAHSIIPVKGTRDPRDGGRDGVVAYSSAHVDYVESEFIVRSPHSCLNNPATVEEVRRILHEHLAHLK